MKNLLNRLELKLFLFMLLGALTFSSCGCDEDCATFDNFKLCSAMPVEDGCPSNSNTLAQDAPYLTTSVEIAKGEGTDRLSVKYFFKDDNTFVEFFSQTKTLAEYNDGSDDLPSKLRVSVGVSRRADRLWPVGEFKVELELSQENIPLNASQNFSIQ